MSDPYVGEIRMFGGNFAPAGWEFCMGQLIPISENDVLFNLIGTTYGGDGQVTFALPNLQSRVPIHMGQGPGISQDYVIGEAAGVESVTLTVQQIPFHNHVPLAGTAGTGTSPTNAVWAGSADLNQFRAPDGGEQPMQAQAVSGAGGNQPHDNMPPYLAINFIISLFGIYPSQT